MLVNKPPMVLKQNWRTENIALFKHLDDGSYAVGFFNMDEEDKELHLTFSDVGLPASAGYDLEMEGVLEAKGKKVYREYMRVKVPAHDCKVFIARLVKQRTAIPAKSSLRAMKLACRTSSSTGARRCFSA